MLSVESSGLVWVEEVTSLSLPVFEKTGVLLIYSSHARDLSID